MSEKNDENEDYIRMAAALILSKRYRATGAPAATVLKLLRKTGMPINEALSELERRFKSVGVLLKRIQTAHGSRKIDRFIAVLDPSLKLDDLRPYDDITLSVLAILFIKQASGDRIPVSSVLNDLALILNDKDKASVFLNKALTRLINDRVIKLDSSKNEIFFTEIGKAMLPPPELIDEILIDALLQGEKSNES